MFIPWIKEKGLCDQREDTGILNEFPLSIKRAIVSHVVNQLDNVDVVQSLKTTTHVQWVLEATGQGFSMPIDALDIIEKCVATYKRWIVGPFDKPKPPGLLLQEIFFYKEMIGHMTYLFEYRATNNHSHLINQVNICEDVLNHVILPAIELYRNRFTQSDWSHLIRLMLGVVDNLYNFPHAKDALSSADEQPFITRALGPLGFQVLMEIFLNSQTTDQELLSAFINISKHWTFTPVIMCWDHLIITLNSRVLALIYGEHFGDKCSTSLVLNWSSSEYSKDRLIEVGKDYVFFAWNFILSLYPDPMVFNDPAASLIFFSTISKLVDKYLAVIDSDITYLVGPSIKLPTLDDILALFGHWIFTSLMADRDGFEEANSIIVKLMCRIFCRNPKWTFERPLTDVNIGCFYSVVMNLLAKPITSKVVQALFISSSNIFLLNLPGVYVIMPSYLNAISFEWDPMSMDPMLQTARINILASLICVPCHFGHAEVIWNKNMLVDQALAKDIHLDSNQFLGFIPMILAILEDITIRETTQVNIIRLFSIIVPFLYDLTNEKDIHSDLFKLVILVLKTMQRTIVSNQVMADVAYAAINTLSMLTYLYPRVEPFPLDIVGEIITSLSEYIQLLSNTPSICDSVIRNAITTLTDWFMVEPKLLEQLDSSIINQVIKTLTHVMENRHAQPNNPNSTNMVSNYTQYDSIQLTAQYALGWIITSSKFPFPIGTSLTSPNINELDILSMILDANGKPITDDPSLCMNPTNSEYLRYFLLNDCIICLIEVPEPKEALSGIVYLIVRGAAGKSVWNTRLHLYDHYPEDNDSDSGAIKHQPNTSSTATKDSKAEATVSNHRGFLTQQGIYENHINDKSEPLIDYLKKNWDHNHADDIVSHIYQYREAEKTYLKKKLALQDGGFPYRPEKVRTPYSSSCKFQYGRMLLSHLGLLRPDTYQSLLSLDCAVNTNNDLFPILMELDRIGDRMVLSAAIVLIDKRTTIPYEYLLYHGAGPTDYQEFLLSLGTQVQLDKDNLFYSWLGTTTDFLPTQTNALYYANYSTELYFLVSNWIPDLVVDKKNKTSNDLINDRKPLLSQLGPVLVVWNLDPIYIPQTNSLNYLHIVISPLPNALYKINLYSKLNIPNMAMPLLDNMILSKRVLGMAVRNAVISAERYFLSEANVIVPYKMRNSKIRQIVENYGIELPYDHFVTRLTTIKRLDEMTINDLKSISNTPLNVSSSKPSSPFFSALSSRLQTSAPKNGAKDSNASSAVDLQKDKLANYHLSVVPNVLKSEPLPTFPHSVPTSRLTIRGVSSQDLDGRSYQDDLIHNQQLSISKQDVATNVQQPNSHSPQSNNTSWRFCRTIVGSDTTSKNPFGRISILNTALGYGSKLSTGQNSKDLNLTIIRDPTTTCSKETRSDLSDTATGLTSDESASPRSSTESSKNSSFVLDTWIGHARNTIHES